ncbi:MAG: GNAT family N-acetyltransferase [Gemmatimonadales bacterium]|nr:GNAT family N-acetyltransferase [Gemmatimonadales bacterium]
MPKESLATDITVRDAKAEDRPFVVTIAQRLVAFGPPSWRTPQEIVAREVRTLEEFFDHQKTGTALLIATLSTEQLLGYVYLETVEDYFTAERHGHVSIIAVSEDGEGKGVGGALMRAAEVWARSSGFHRLTLNVFEANSRARAVYAHLGYRVETLRYVKVLDETVNGPSDR